jgi:TetR/AcrR family transcriptional repressor of nem operon
MTPRKADPRIYDNLMSAATQLMLAKGYNATRVDEICALGKLSKGTFFHYFPDKAALGEAVLRSWIRDGSMVYRDAPFWGLELPLERMIGYIDFTAKLLKRMPQKGCMVGTLTQELATTHPKIRHIAANSFKEWASGVQKLLDDVVSEGQIEGGTEVLAYHFIVIYEGALILAKALGRPAIVDEQLRLYKHLVKCIAGQNLKQTHRVS